MLSRVAGVNSSVGGQEFRVTPREPTASFVALQKVGRFWSAGIGMHYRALAVESGEDLVWFWIGTHAQYDRLTGT
jgi:hypothetical protein